MSIQPITDAPRPFLKWLGGKTQLLPELLKHAPKSFERYHEPFLGGGALFFALRPKIAFLSDANPWLVNAYCCVRDEINPLLQLLHHHQCKHHEIDGFYYAIRERFNQGTCSRLEGAAAFIYLNKTCFNGLWRVNRSGAFNVPKGSYKNPTVCDEVNLRRCSRALDNASIICSDFSIPQEQPTLCDFWYADPPYIPVSATSNFTGYTQAGFGLSDQRRLRDYAFDLKTKGVNVLLSNAAVSAAIDLYYNGFMLHEVDARRNVNSKADRRGVVKELVIS